MTMRNKFEVVRGAVRRPLASILTGRSGIGKTYFCSTIPSRFFICVEQGLQGASPDQIDELARFEGPSNLHEFFQMLEAFKSFAKEEGHRHLVIDSLSGLEALVHKQACNSENVAHMDAKAFKAAWTAAMPLWQRIQRGLDSVRDIGVHVWVIAHGQESTESVDTGETFTKYDLAFQGTGKSLGEVRQMWRAWPDNVLFMDWQASVKQGKSMGQKAVGVYKSRIIWTKEQPRLYAKSRLALPETVPATWRDLERAMRSGAAQTAEKTTAKINAIIAQLADPASQEELAADLAAARTPDALAAVLSRAQGVLSIQQMEEAEEAPLEPEEAPPALEREEAPPALAQEEAPAAEVTPPRPKPAPAQSPELAKAVASCLRAFPAREADIQSIASDDFMSDDAKVNALRAWYARAKTEGLTAPANDNPAPAPEPRKRTTAEQKMAKKARFLAEAIRRDEPGSVGELDALMSDYASGPNGLDDLGTADLEALISQLEGILNGEVAA